VELEPAMEHVDALEVLERAGGQVVDVVEQLADLVAGDQAPEDEVALGAEAHVLLDVTAVAVRMRRQ
jgi:hypothetical protein